MEFILLSTFVKFLKSRSRHLLKTEIDDTLQSVPTSQFWIIIEYKDSQT